MQHCIKNQVAARLDFSGGGDFKGKALQFFILLPYNASMKLSRSQIKEGLSQIPMETILGVSGKGLTAKQKTFCKEVAMGQTGAEAYRRSYSKKAKPTTAANQASKLKAKPTIASTIEAMEGAIRAAEYQTPAGLRALVIQTLVQTMIDPEVKDAVKIAAAKTLGTVTEVAAFTERKETRIIRSSEDAKTKLLAKLRDMMKANATDATIIDADSLLMELTPSPENEGEGDTHPVGTPRDAHAGTLAHVHTIPLKQSQENSDPPPDENFGDLPVHASGEDPPIGVEK